MSKTMMKPEKVQEKVDQQVQVPVTTTSVPIDLRDNATEDWWQNAVDRLFDWPERLYHRIRPEHEESSWMPQVFPSEWFGGMERMLDLPFRGEMGFRVEEHLSDGEYVVRADLPGIDPDRDVEVTVDNGQLRISAHRRSETTSNEKGRFRSEVRYGSFSRVLPAPKGLTDADVKATYKDGVLEVRVPAPEPVATSMPAAKVKVTRA
jgi:HSP20 family protein